VRFVVRLWWQQALRSTKTTRNLRQAGTVPACENQPMSFALADSFWLFFGGPGV
jgi:hypothetical protein